MFQSINNLNAAQFHLMLTHIPVTLIPTFFIFLFLFKIKKNTQGIRFILYGLIFLGFIIIPTYLTGEPTEKLLDGFPAVTEEFIEPHEEAATVGLVLTITVSVFATLSLLLKSEKRQHLFLNLTLLVLFIASLDLFYIAHLGGQIRHTEIRNIKQNFNKE